MRRTLLALLCALSVAPWAGAQEIKFGLGAGGGTSIASGGALSGCSANSVLYANASTLLACGGSPAPTYDATNIRLQVGTGGTTQQGWSMGYLGSSGASGIWSTNVTPSTTNYTLSDQGSNGVLLNAPSGGLLFRVANATKAQITNSAGYGMFITAGTATTDVQALSTTQTWNNAAITFTGHKYVVTDTASAVGSLHSQWRGGAAGATTLMSLSKGGQLYMLGWLRTGADSTAIDYSDYGVTTRSAGVMAWTSGTNGISGTDLRLEREAAATIQMGADVNGAAVAQTLKAHDGITGTDIAGANLTIAGGRGTGAGAGGNRIDQTSNSLATGTTAQTLQDRTLIVAKVKALTAAAATNVVLINVASGAYGGGEMEYTVQASDGTDHQARSGRIQWAVVNKAGTETCTVSGASEAADSSTVAASSGTLTYAITADTTAANGCYIAFNAVSSLVETTLNIAYRITANGGTSTFTAQ